MEYNFHRKNAKFEKSFFHDDVVKWKHFPCYWHFVRGIHRSPVNSPHKGQWRRALMFSLVCVEYIIETVEYTIETLVIWDAIALIMTSDIALSVRRYQSHIGLALLCLRSHCNECIMPTMQHIGIILIFSHAYKNLIKYISIARLST